MESDFDPYEMLIVLDKQVVYLTRQLNLTEHNLEVMVDAFNELVKRVEAIENEIE